MRGGRVEHDRGRDQGFSLTGHRPDNVPHADAADIAMRDPERLAWNSALRDRRHADDWWIANHGPLAPSRLDAELDDAFALLAVNAELGFGGWRGHPVRKLRLACGFFIVYQVRPILREVLFLRILAAPRMHG